MSTAHAITRTLTRSPLIAVVLYAVVVGGLLAITGTAIANILDHQRALAQTSDLLDQLQGRRARGAGTSPLAAEHPGTPFLEGPTVTVAGATLLQRVAAAVGNVGGTIQSSQVDVLGTQAKEAQARAEASRVEKARGGQAPAAALRVGSRVHHLGLGRDVEVLALEGDDAVVAAGPLKLRVARDVLAGAREVAPPSRLSAQGRRQAADTRAQRAAPAPLEAGVPRLDVRGLRADEALREVQGFLDRAFRDGETAVLLVHGHGTGALRQALRAALSESPYVQGHRPGDAYQGGDGVTVVALKDE